MGLEPFRINWPAKVLIRHPHHVYVTPLQFPYMYIIIFPFRTTPRINYNLLKHQSGHQHSCRAKYSQGCQNGILVGAMQLNDRTIFSSRKLNFSLQVPFWMKEVPDEWGPDKRGFSEIEYNNILFYTSTNCFSFQVSPIILATSDFGIM